jgi:uncharacterized damage-inducible protein DinB
MSEIKKLVEQLKRAYSGNAWHGPAVAELLARVSAKQASSRPLPEGHTIWELVLHIAAWDEVATKRLGGVSSDVPDDDNFPRVDDPSPNSWRDAQERLSRAQEELVARVSALAEENLNDTAAGTDYSNYDLVMGVIQHNAYHGGQIALLRKIMPS